MTCTWKDCSQQGVHAQRGIDDAPWATLCDEHHNEMVRALGSDDAKAIMACWVKAKGGTR